MPTDVSTNNKRIAKNALYMYINMGITMLVSLYTSRIILQNLGISDYGIYNIVGSVVAAFAFLSEPLGTATQRFYNFELGKNNKSQLNVIFNMSLLIYVILSIGLMILVEIIGVWFIYNKMSLPPERIEAALFAFHASMLTFVASLIKLPFDALILAHEKMSFYAIISFMDAALKLLNAFSLAYLMVDKLYLYSFNVLIIICIGLFATAFYCLRKFKYISFKRPKEIWDKKTFRDLFNFSGWSLFGAVANMTANQGLNILLNVFFGVIINAAMGIANQVNAAISQFATSFQTAFRPQIVKYYASNEIETLEVLIKRTSKLSYILLFGLLCPTWFNMSYILELWLGVENVPEYTAEFSILMTTYALLNSLSAPMWMTVQATGTIKKYQIVISSAIFLNIVFAYIFLLMGFPPTIVLLIKCVLDILYLAIRLHFMKTMINFNIGDYLNKVMMPLFVLSIVPIVILMVVVTLVETGLVRAIATIIGFYLLYIPLVLYVALTKNERDVILEYATNKIKTINQ